MSNNTFSKTIIIIGVCLFLALVFLTFAIESSAASAPESQVTMSWSEQTRLIAISLGGIAKARFNGCPTGPYKNALWQARHGKFKAARAAIANGKRSLARCRQIKSPLSD